MSRRKREPYMQADFIHINSYPQLIDESGKAFLMLYSLFVSMWEVEPESAEHALETIANIMKGYADSYSRLLMAGKIPEDKILHSIHSTRDVGENQ